MSDWRETYKPAGPAWLHLLLAASLWTIVGGLLLFFGARWVLAGEIPHAGAWLTLALAGGVLKAWFVLRRSARRTVARIRARGDGRCIGGFLSPGTWALVIGMAVGGRILRQGLLPSPVVGLIYVLVGTALLLAAGPLWNACRSRDCASS
jgi:hypothetical protein